MKVLRRLYPTLEFFDAPSGRYLDTNHSCSVIVNMEFLHGMNTVEFVIIQILDYGNPVLRSSNFRST